MPNFESDVEGTYVATLMVTDEGGLSDSDPVNIGSDNLAPTANAGPDQLVVVNSPVQLDGLASSDPEFDALGFSWNLSAPATSSAALDDPSSGVPPFTPDLEGLYIASLTVSDFIGPGSPDTIEITAATLEDFSIDLTVEAGDLVTSLSGPAVRNQGNQRALLNHLAQAVRAIQKGQFDTAIEKIEDAISRTDGCVLREGVPDDEESGFTVDWVTDCTAQSETYELLNDVSGTLTL